MREACVGQYFEPFTDSEGHRPVEIVAWQWLQMWGYWVLGILVVHLAWVPNRERAPSERTRGLSQLWGYMGSGVGAAGWGGWE